MPNKAPPKIKMNAVELTAKELTITFLVGTSLLRLVLTIKSKLPNLLPYLSIKIHANRYCKTGGGPLTR
jgi:hypothetical protein